MNFLRTTFDLGPQQADEAAAAEYISESGADHRRAILRQGWALLASRCLPWEEVAAAANRNLNTAEEVQQWLVRMLRMIEDTPPGR